eukprot:gene25907-11583_t
MSKIQLPNNPQFQAALYNISPLAGSRVDHFVIHDSKGDSAVLEWSATAEGVWKVKPNPLGVTTNSPSLEEQYAYYYEWKSNTSASFGPTAAIMTPGFCGVGFNITNSSNANCNSMGRFTAMATLKASLYNPLNGAGTPPSPQSPLSNPDPAYPAYLQAIDIINWVAQYQWPNISGAFIGPLEMTVFQILRDHTLNIKTPASLQWNKINIKRVFNNLVSSKRKGVIALPLGSVCPPSKDWSVDRSKLKICGLCHDPWR